MPEKRMGSFYQSWKIRNWGFILVRSILSSALLLHAAECLANPATPANTQQANNKVNTRGSMGDSLVQTILGADALKPCPGSSTCYPTGYNPPPNSYVANPGSSVNPTSSTMPFPLAQASTFPDVQGSWARSFIDALAARDIIKGFPDGLYRPDDPVTRSQFAAMIRKAFPKAPIREAVQFVDVPPNYWGYQAIQDAYQRGFLEGYPNRVFIPNQNIPRVQVLVSLATGLNLTAMGTPGTVIGSAFQDAAQIPNYARDQIAATTENGIVVNYPNVAFLNPDRVATRAEVAAFIYQALVRAGQAPPLNVSDIGTQYIVGYRPPTPPPLTPEQVAALRQQFLLPEPPLTERLRRALGGASSISTPTAFGADNFQPYVGFSFQSTARSTNQTDGGIALGLGLGDAERYVGLESTFSSYSTVRSGFANNAGVSFKVHRLLPYDLAVAVGVENLILKGNPDPNYSSVYGVISKVFPLGRQQSAEFVPSVTASVGVGGGRYRAVSEINGGGGGVNYFGSVGVRLAEPITLIGEYNQDLNLGISISPFKNIPLVITPAVADITSRANDHPRFILGVGYGITF